MVQARGSGARADAKLNDLDKNNLTEIFKLEARTWKHNRVNLNGLNRIFKTVGFEPNVKQISVFKELIEANGGTINHQMFLSVFDLKKNKGFKEIDIRNAFRLLSKEYDRPGMVSLSRVREFFNEMGLSELEIVQLTTQLQPLCGVDGYFDFEDFVTKAF